jgi:hypothetical protein
MSPSATSSAERDLPQHSSVAPSRSGTTYRTQLGVTAANPGADFQPLVYSYSSLSDKVVSQIKRRRHQIGKSPNNHEVHALRHLWYCPSRLPFFRRPDLPKPRGTVGDPILC